VLLEVTSCRGGKVGSVGRGAEASADGRGEVAVLRLLGVEAQFVTGGKGAEVSASGERAKILSRNADMTEEWLGASLSIGVDALRLRDLTETVVATDSASEKDERPERREDEVADEAEEMDSVQSLVSTLL